MVEVRKSNVKLDYIRNIEKQRQKLWEEGKYFEANPVEDKEKYFATFPYPYMNGRLHLGHAYSFSKCEFAIGYQRLLGKNCLLPFGLHCTGMPIKACADKLKQEITQYGFPPKFPDGHCGSQWDSMKKMELSDEELIKFSDPLFWLEYFPPLALADISLLGVKVDKRRSFITTDVNPFYDSFVKWQFEKLKERGRIMFGRRHTIYSPKDDQPCMDHDRMIGETVCPQEFLAVKHKLLEDKFGVFKDYKNSNIYLLASTLRPETLYGQTNLFVHPENKYYLFISQNDELFVSGMHALRNLAYQGLTKRSNEIDTLLEISGKDLIGCKVASVLSVYKEVYVLPMMSIKLDKCTGIVISVPSDSPDDYAAMNDLKSKAALRQKFGVEDDAVMNYNEVKIINVPPYGSLTARSIVNELKITSQNDSALLKEAKERVYKASYYGGVMLVGEFAGKPLMVAKPEVKKLLINENVAFTYMEPESVVMSRSRDICVVALCDQWYLAYGESEWKKDVAKALGMLETYSDEVRNNFHAVLDWLQEHACSRSFGLGSKLPWDPQYLIESLSDSTIYMAYYTVCHLLQQGSLNGKSSSINPNDVTPAVWDYVFLNGPMPACKIDKSLLNKMKEEFNYWYPFDLRASGKDLIPNHLMFCLYNHVAMWPEIPRLWPQAYKVNGYLMLNSEKMSKSTGNFMLLSEVVQKYGADASRVALADAGDTVEDANFVEKTADSAVLRLYKFIEWCSEMIYSDNLRVGPCDSLADRIFANEMRRSIVLTKEAYEKMLYRDALKYGLYELQAARDWYKELSLNSLHRDLVMEYIKNQCIIIAPICPHVADHVYHMLNGESVMHAKWPVCNSYDLQLHSCSSYLETSVTTFRNSLKTLKDLKNKNKVAFVPPKTAFIYVGEDFLEWQKEVLSILRDNLDKGIDNKEYARLFKENEKFKGLNFQKVMSFFSYYKSKFEVEGFDVVESKRIDEYEILQANLAYLLKSLELDELHVSKNLKTPLSDDPLPLRPIIVYK